MNYLSLFSSSIRALPRFSALASAVLSQADDLIALVSGFPEAFSLATAAGAQLSALGTSLGIPRPDSASDTDYRALIRAKLRLFRWPGTNESVPALLAEISPGADLCDNGDGSVTVSGLSHLPCGDRSLLPVPAGIAEASTL
ncbi:MAG: hypothetical protein IJI21_10680 [Clostridia bacterium]|nr:hypothetical protein [Clostridia bacterium]